MLPGGYHGIEITTERLWDEYEEKRAEAALKYQKAEGSKQGHHGRNGGRPPKFADVSSGGI